MEQKQFTSIDYKCISVSGFQDLNELSKKIRDKNFSTWQTKTPKREIIITIGFTLSRLSHIEIKNHGTPQIELRCCEKNDKGLMLNEFTCLPKTTLYVPKQQSTKGNSEDSKVIRLLENSFQPKTKYNTMEIVLLNPHYDSFPLDLGLTYFILFAKTDNFIEKTSPNIKIDHFFDSEKMSSNKKQGFPFDSPVDRDSFFAKMNNSQFKKERYQEVFNRSNPKKENNALSLNQNKMSIKNSPVDKESVSKLNRGNVELLLAENHSNKKLEMGNNSNLDKKFEEDLQKALEESIKIYEGKKPYENNVNYLNDEMIGIDKEKNYQEYKNMIYENLNNNNEGYINENSMFPLLEEDLSGAYLFLEKIHKNI